MHTGAITSHIDVAQLTLYAFWLFFAGLIIYLRGEDRREGYSIQPDSASRRGISRYLLIPKPKTFLLGNGETRTAPRHEAPAPISTALPIGGAGYPLHPVGDPMLAGIGPGSYANRPDVPDSIFDTGAPKIVPLRTDHEFSIAAEDPDPRGMRVVAADRKIAGTVTDVWVDRAEVVIRYIEIEIPTSEGARRVLAPMPAVSVDGRRRRVTIGAILSTQFANVPATKSPDQITLLEEDKISAYYAAGRLYATPDRQEPLI